ncbi:hypothetical protein NA57DRAFT_72162 [Rhizodiscina lignyota]|uniref:Uncharacterized protein n=1 Tax=Rhizodiscina lignyota TaxID=1504668 RepID=A0A9P4MD76_9PEZI|nr:hypothetical protein NA57DRAFT_72162 [Rhizodiscina lignyota]
MRFSLIAALTLCGSCALAAPAPNAVLQKNIQTLEITINNVINDIVQSKASLKKDYVTGGNQFGDLISKVAGPLPCSPFVPGHPKTANAAISYLQQAQLGLQDLSLHLMDPTLSVSKQSFHPYVCSAWGFYWGVESFV